MNRTQKYVAAGVGTAVILAIIALVAFSPNLHTQTPLSAAPPASGGSTNGGSSGASTSNTTTPTCNVTSPEQPGGDQSGQDAIAAHASDDGNRTNGTGGHAEGACGSAGWDPDSVGDQESAAHAAAQAYRAAEMLVNGALALAPALSGWIATASSGIASLGGLLAEPLLGTAPPAGFL